MKINTRLVLAGTVKFFNPAGGWGFITPDIANPVGRDIHFRMESGLWIVQGTSGPEFQYRTPVAPRFNGGDRVVYILQPHNPYGAHVWGYKIFYDRALSVTSNVPEFRIMRQHRFVNDNPRKATVVVGATKLPQLLQWLEDGTVEEFNPHRVHGNCTTTMWFEEMKSGGWVRSTPPALMKFCQVPAPVQALEPVLV